MKKRALGAVVLMLSGLQMSAVLLACGDKFLLPARGTRFQQAPPERAAAAVLVYANPASPLPAALTKLSVDAALRKVGYRPTTVNSLDALERALRQGGWGVIVVDLADSGSVRGRVQQGRPAPVVVSVAQNASREEFAAARREHAHVLKSPSRSQAFVEAIDEAVSDWQAGGGRQKSR